MQPLPDLMKLDLPQLIDLLSVYTADYTRMFLEKDRGIDFEECKYYIELIQNEINARASHPEITTSRKDMPDEIKP